MMQERKNDLFKLAHHRVVARVLKTNPGLIVEAREVVDGWKRDPRHPYYVDAWDHLLSRSIDDVRREIVRRTPEAARLRTSSPFPLAATRVALDDSSRGRLRDMATRLATAQ